MAGGVITAARRATEKLRASEETHGYKAVLLESGGEAEREGRKRDAGWREGYRS